MIDFNLGKPHSQNYHCYDHVRLFLANIGITINDIEEVKSFAHQKTIMLSLMNSGLFEKVDKPKNGDIAVFERLCHFGVFYDGYISHCPIDGVVCIEQVKPNSFWRVVDGC